METNLEEASFVDPFLLIVTLTITIIMIIGNLYFLAAYSHHADTGFGSSAACKFIVVSIILFTKFKCLFKIYTNLCLFSL